MPDNSKGDLRNLEISEGLEAEARGEIKSISDFKEEIGQSSAKDVSLLSKTLLKGAFYLGASDVHIEPKESEVKIRLRVDGILQDVTAINQEIYEGLVSRIKLLSGLKLNVTDRPQDGRFSASLGGLSIEIRTSSLPSEYGESIVLRVLNPKGLISLEALGLREDLLSLIKKEIKKPNGMIVLTGPTGSGKTTTLYAFLKKIQRSEIKIITIEDPVEYHLPGISQTQVNPSKGYDFASGLQSIMRQDPDVILVGEIRDSKTCKISLQAALTGHLVLTTLHTNDAAGTVARMTSLEGDLKNIGPAINLAIAQRLVRKLCKKCSKAEPAPALLLMKMKKALKGLPNGIKIPRIDKGLKISQAKGCKHCNFTGYRGRVGIFEIIVIDGEMEDFILKNPSIASLRKEATRRGMVAMYQDGLIKVLEGITTIEEVERVAGD